MSNYTDRKAGILQNLAVAFLEKETTAKAAAKAKYSFDTATDAAVRSSALGRGETRVVPVAPGEYVIISRDPIGPEYTFQYGLTNVVAEEPEQPHYKDQIR